MNFIFLFHIRVYPDNKIWANVAKIKTDISQILNFKSKLEKDKNWRLIARFLGFLYISRYLSNLRFIIEKASFLKLILILINTNQKIVWTLCSCSRRYLVWNILFFFFIRIKKTFILVVATFRKKKNRKFHFFCLPLDF